MGSNVYIFNNIKQSSQEEQKRLEEYVSRQQPQVNQFYSQNQLNPIGNYDDDAQFYHSRNTQTLQPRVVPQVQVAKTVAVKSEVFLLKSSLKTVQLNQDSYAITFKYTSEFPAIISIFLCAKQTVTQNDITESIVSTKGPQQNVFEIPAAKEAEFPNNLFKFQLSQFKRDELTKPLPQEQYYPLIIKMEGQQQTTERKRSIYYCQFQMQGQKVELHCFRTKLEQSGQGYVLNDVYGIHESCLSGKSDKECVVCMAEKINTMIMPCKHMVLCNACCDDMRQRQQKCPMCRGQIESFMQLEGTPLPESQNNKNQQIISTEPGQQPKSQAVPKNTHFTGQGVQLGGQQQQ